MTRTEHSATRLHRVTRRERDWKAESDSRDFTKAFQEAMEKTRKKWKAQLREELELEDALDFRGQGQE